MKHSWKLCEDQNRKSGETRSEFHGHRSNELSWGVIIGIIVAFALISPISLDLRAGCSFRSLDGGSWAELFSYHSRFATPFALSAVDPLQGMFDAYPNGYFGYAWVAVVNFLTGSSSLSIPIAISLLALLLCMSTLCFALTLGLSRATALLAGLTASLTAYSFFNCDGIDGIFALTPQTGYAIALAFLMLSTFQVSGQIQKKWLWLPILCIVLLVISMITQAALDISIVLPGIFFFGFVLLIASDGRVDFFKKLTVAVTTITFLIALGIPNYFLSFGASIDTTFFYDYLVNFSLPNFPSIADFWHDYLLIVLRVNPHTNDIEWITGKSIFVLLGYGIAAVNAFTHKSRALRIFSIGAIVYVHVVFLLYFIAHYSQALLGGKYNVPIPYHFLYIQYPVSAILFGALLQTVISHLFHKISPTGSSPKLLSERVMAGISLLILSAGIVTPFYQLPAPASNGPSHLEARLAENPPFSAGRGMKLLTTNKIVSTLQESIGLTSDSAFRGTVATFTFTNPGFAKHVNARTGTDYAVLAGGDAFWEAVFGNEMRNLGQWRFSIPTLYQASATRSAQFTYMTTAFLTRPTDHLTRQWLVLTRPNKKLLALWGVRFIITDYALDDWIEVARMSAQAPQNTWAYKFQSKYLDSQNATAYLYENAHTNLADYSPIKVEHSDDAEEMALRLADPTFDPRITVIAAKTVSSSSETLSSITSSRLEYVDGHLHLSAESSGESLLVLPVQFTNCWAVFGKDAEKIELFRANFLQLGVRFRGTIDVHLSFAHGPFWHHNCRNDDARDLRNMGVNPQSLASLRKKLESRAAP